MADTKISALTAATSVSSSDSVVVVQGGVTKRAPVSLLPAGGSGGTGGATTNTPFVFPAATAGTGSDDTTALKDALNRVGPGVQLMLEPRTYLYSGVIDDALLPSGPKSGYTVEGNGARLLATVSGQSAVKVNGAGVSWRNTEFELRSRSARLDTYNSCLLLVFGDDFKGSHLKAKGGSSTGFFFTGVDGLELDYLEVEDTLADAIHITGGSKNVKVLRPFVRSSGDDGVAVVSYLPGKQFDSGLCENVVVIEPVVKGSKGGRGIACVGGRNVTFQSAYVEDTFAAGAYISSEAGVYNTYPFMNCKLIGKSVIRNANTNFDPAGVANPVDHGSIQISNMRPASASTMCYDLQIEDVDIFDTRATNPWDVGVIGTNGGVVNMTGLQLRKLAIINGTNATMYNTMTAAQRTATTVAADGKTYTNFRGYDWTRTGASTAIAA